VTGLAALLDRLPRTTLVLGKGGVGKTTCAAGIAAAFAARGESVLLISTDPAAALASVLDSAVGGTPTPIPGVPGLHARQLDARELRRAFLAEWRETIAEIIDRGTYLDREDVDGLVDAALPGADEIFALLALADLLAGSDANEWQRIVVDTAPTGHTLRLLALPKTFRALIAMLESMQAKHRFMVRALTHRYRADRADAFLRQMESRVEALRAVLADASSVAALLVTRAEPVVVAETTRYAAALRELDVFIAGTIVNAVPPVLDSSAHAAIVTIDAMTDAGSLCWIPREVTPPRGIPALRDFKGSELLKTAKGLNESARGSSIFNNSDPLKSHPPIRTLTIVGGKGGVGKTTVACALAILAADSRQGDVLLVSTDPAPSIADALGERDAGWASGDEEHSVDDTPGLVSRQIDATAAFARFREEYQARIDALFDAVLARGIDAAHDRAILRDLLSLAPPGIDELYALSILGEALAAGRFTRIVVDPAPTGHLLRLLEMPTLALDWSHRLMRLMLKYREIAGLGDAARELLDFARRTRSLDALLRDRSRAGVLLVSLDEAVVRRESERLIAELRARDTDLIGVIWNRVDPNSMESVVPLPAEPPVSQYLAEATTPPPVGAPAIRRWANTWQSLNATS
jgi:arsenite-transporting ATPase